MSTRCTTHFKYGARTEAIVYRHHDGYPEGAGADIERFLDECEKLKDPSFGDPSYLAAKYVVFLAREFNNSPIYDESTEEHAYQQNASPLDFLSVGVLMKDPGDIAFRYEVDCSGRVRPSVKCFKKSGRGWSEVPVSKPAAEELSASASETVQ